MKPLPWLAALALAGTLAHADFIVEQTTESPFGAGDLVFKVKGDRARVETPDSNGGASVTLIDLVSGRLTNLIPSQKVAYQVDLAAARQKAEAAMRAAGLDVSALKPVATGQKDRVGDWAAELYTVSLGGSEMRLWVSTVFPHGREIREQMARFTRAASGGALDPNTFAVPGLVVQSSADVPQGKMLTRLKSVKEGDLPASDFVVPEGYEISGPGMRPQ